MGLAPYFDPGTRSPRNDVPSPEGGEIWDQMKEWHVDADFMWKQGQESEIFGFNIPACRPVKQDGPN